MENKSRIVAQVMITISIFSAAVIRLFLERHDSINALDTSIKWFGLAGVYLFIFTTILIKDSDSSLLRACLYLNLILSGIVLLHLSYVYLTSNWPPLAQFIINLLFTFTAVANYLVLPSIILFLAIINYKD